MNGLAGLRLGPSIDSAFDLNTDAAPNVVAGESSNGAAASAEGSSIGGGGDNRITAGAFGVIAGGRDNTVSAPFASVAGGYGATATLYGQQAYANGFFAVPGDAQAGEYVVRNAVPANNTLVELYLDGVSRRLTIAPGRAIHAEVRAVILAQNGNSFAADWRCNARNDPDSAPIGTTGVCAYTGGTGVGSPGTTVNALIDSANNALVVTAICNPGAGCTSPLRVVAGISTVEVAYP